MKESYQCQMNIRVVKHPLQLRVNNRKLSRVDTCLGLGYPPNKQLSGQQNTKHNCNLITSERRCFYLIPAEILEQRRRKFLGGEGLGVALSPAVRQNRRAASIFVFKSVIIKKTPGPGVEGGIERVHPLALSLALRWPSQETKA